MKSKVFFVSISILSFLFLSTISLLAQEKKIDIKDLPKAVTESFHKSYPKAEIKGAATEKENGNTYYEVESIEGDQQRDILYKKDGTVAEIEENISNANIPDFVKTSVMKKYSNGKIKKAEKLTKGSKVSYEVVVEHDGKKSEVALDAKGNIEKMDKMKKENKEKEGAEKDEENEDNDND